MDTSKVTRITVVSDKGVEFERYDLFENGVELHLQDDGRTLKIFPVANTPLRISDAGYVAGVIPDEELTWSKEMFQRKYGLDAAQ